MRKTESNDSAILDQLEREATDAIPASILYLAPPPLEEELRENPPEAIFNTNEDDLDAPRSLSERAQRFLFGGSAIVIFGFALSGSVVGLVRMIIG